MNQSYDKHLPHESAMNFNMVSSSSTQDTQPNGSSNNLDSSWFPALRSKLSSFSMSDWLVSLGLSKRKSFEGQTDERLTVSAPTTREQSLEPNIVMEEETSSEILGPVVDDDLLTPIAAENENGERFELPNFWLNLEPGRSYMDTLELQHFGPLEDLVPIGQKHLGKGHEFHVTQLVNPTWCDKCGDFIWGFYKQAVRCKFCNYTCHYKCRLLVTLDCRSLTDSMKSASTDATYLTAKSINFPDDTHCSNSIVEIETVTEINLNPLDWPNDNMPHGKALVEAIEHYNLTADGLEMKLDEDKDSAFSGYLLVHMNFTRPINIVAGQRPPSLYDVMKDDTIIPDSERRTITSFFLPRNTVKTVHITSDTTVRELIVSLLKKFKVADNPLKFALYERQTEQEGTMKARLQRLRDDTCPLRLMLLWGTNSGKQLVLQENETGDILWDAFEIPELTNFLKILELEEQQYIWQIRQKYNLYRHYVELELRTKRGQSERGTLSPDSRSQASLAAESSEKSNGEIWKPQEEPVTMKVSDASPHAECTCDEKLTQKNQITEWETFGTV